MVRSSPRRQRGLALLMAMLIVVIATTLAVSILHEEKFTIRKTAHIQMNDRAAACRSRAVTWPDTSRTSRRVST